MKLRSLILLFFVSTLALSSRGAVNSNLNSEKIYTELKKTKKTIEKNEIKQRKVLANLYEINRSMKKLVGQKGDLARERMGLESSIRNLAKNIIKLQVDIDKKKEKIKSRIISIFRVGGEGVASILLSTKSAAELDRTIKILSLIAKRDHELVKNYHESILKLQDDKEKLASRVSKLKSLELKIKEQELKLAQEQENKNKALDKIRENKNYRISQLKGLRERSRGLAKNQDSGVFDLLFQDSFFEKKGKLASPVKGVLKQGFGLVNDSDFGLSFNYKGHFYSASTGSIVQSIFSGTVVYTRWLPGYGYTAIIDHGDHYYTVYSYLQNLVVKEQQRVKSEQMIGYSGDSSQDLGSGIYFEIRHFSEPYDPKAWLAEYNTIQISSQQENL